MASGDDILKILVATDLHVGYAEKDPVRGEDSFLALEEILRIGKERKVDFVLLGGDLFHENKPSRRCVVRVLDLFRRYSLGPGGINFRIVSDQAVNFPFPEWFQKANYEDPCFQVSMPVFSIHGNHDDPAGDGRLAALDVLATANLVNYFGKAENIDDITVYPILFEKGTTQVAIYGLGNIRDERLYHTFQQKKVRFMKPTEESGDWFKIFVLHQNRVHHTQKSCIQETMIDEMFDLVIWGHEHECRIKPEPSTVHPFHIIQPGSSVATSLSESESRRKHVGVLEIKGDNWRLIPVPLTSVRPFLICDVELASATDIDISNEKAVSAFLAEKVDELIEQAKETFQTDALPLIRVRVDMTGGVRLHPARFGQLFVGKVANPKDILLFKKKKVAGTNATDRMDQEDLEEDELHDAVRALDETTVGEIIRSLLKTKNKSLEFFPEAEISVALQEFVDKNTKSAFSDTIAKWLKDTHQLVLEQDNLEADGDHIRDFIRQRTDQLNLAYMEHDGEEDGAAAPDAAKVDDKARVKKERVAPVDEDSFRDETGDDGFFHDAPSSASPTRVKKEKKSSTTPRRTSRRSSVKSEPGSPDIQVATPPPARPKRGAAKRRLEETSPSASPQPRKQRKTSTPSTVKTEKKNAAPTIISLSDSDDDTPQPAPTTTKRRWGRKK